MSERRYMVEFRLTMPGRASWDGRWSGVDRNYVLYRSLRFVDVKRLFGDDHDHAWYHSWPDGWAARIDGHVMDRGAKHSKSDGFAGYDWMVDNIIEHGSTEKPAELVPA